MRRHANCSPPVLRDVDVQTYGNVTAAMAFLQGLAVEDLPRSTVLDRVDPDYQVISRGSAGASELADHDAVPVHPWGDDGHPLDLRVAELLSAYGSQARSTFRAATSKVDQSFPLPSCAPSHRASRSAATRVDHVRLESGDTLATRRDIRSWMARPCSKTSSVTRSMDFCYPRRLVHDVAIRASCQSSGFPVRAHDRELPCRPAARSISLGD